MADELQNDLSDQQYMAWLLYSMLPSALDPEKLAFTNNAATKLSNALGTSNYSLSMQLPPDFLAGDHTVSQPPFEGRLCCL